MTNIKAITVKELRTRTGAGMMNCKKALVETDGDIEKAIDWLKAKGLSTAAKKSGRVTAEGLTSLMVKDNKAVVVEVNSETDFVAKNEDFQKLVSDITENAFGFNDIESLSNKTTDSGVKISDKIVDAIATIGENLTLRRVKSLEVSEGVIGTYIHNKITDNLGKIAVAVVLESANSNKEKLSEVAKQIAMHIAAIKPVALNKESVDPEIIEREKQVFIQKSKESGKPDNIIEKMVDGRIRKFLEEIVLLEQNFVMDNKMTITQLLANLSKELGSDVSIKEFVRFELGEGIEKNETNFADEVAAASKI